MSTSDILPDDEKMSQAHISIDINENLCQETVVGYPVNSKWFFWSARQSSNETTNETNVTQHKNDTAQSKDLTKSLLNDPTHSNNPTHRTPDKTNSRARINCDKWSLFDTCIGAFVLMGFFPFVSIFIHNPTPLNFP